MVKYIDINNETFTHPVNGTKSSIYINGGSDCSYVSFSAYRNDIPFDLLEVNKIDYIRALGVEDWADGIFPEMNREDLLKVVDALNNDLNKKYNPCYQESILITQTRDLPW